MPSSALEQFRQHISVWLDGHCPASMRTAMPEDEAIWGGRKEQFKNPDSKVWLERMAAKGWLAPTWPSEYGGAGLSHDEAKVLQQELHKKHCRPALMSLGIHMMGPTIMEYGTQAQKLAFLPDIAKGNIRWCQGYSEPGAGSDLASLQCKAEREGDYYRVSGQKVWTSFADASDYIFCLVRTDKNAPKHEGISVLLIDMLSEGVSVKPINLISGNSHFSEVFLDNVLVPKEHLLGEENKGWPIAKRMLQHERNMMGGKELSDNYNPDLALLAKAYLGEQNGQLQDAVLREKIAANQMNLKAIELTGLRVFQEIKAGEASMASAILKYAMTASNIEKFELLLDVAGSQGLAWNASQGVSDDELRFAREWAFSKIQTIGGGTSEIQLNIIAKNILQLPE